MQKEKKRRKLVDQVFRVNALVSQGTPGEIVKRDGLKAIPGFKRSAEQLEDLNKKFGTSAKVMLVRVK